MLDVSEAKADALRLSRAKIDLAAVVRVFSEFFQPGFNEHGCALRVQVVSPVMISADPALLHRVIANLFDNEVKHLPPASTVWVCVEEANGKALFTVEDDGPGFDPEVIAHLFERGAKSRTSRGHGVGLAFVQAVVRAHGGTVDAANRKQGGIRIEVTLPMHPPIAGLHLVQNLHTPDLAHADLRPRHP